MKNTIIADTGFWLALANAKDKHHIPAKKALVALHASLITTWPVMTETCHLLLNRLGRHSQISFVDSFKSGGFEVFSLQVHHAPRLKDLMVKYADLPMDLADASLVILAESLGHGRILSTDRRDFNSYRWKIQHPFENLLFS